MESAAPDYSPQCSTRSRSAQGITPYTDLSQVQVIRKRAEGLGGGRIKTNLNFLSLITEGQRVAKYTTAGWRFLKSRQKSNRTAGSVAQSWAIQFEPTVHGVCLLPGVSTFPGGVKIPQGSSLNQAISLAGGTKLLKGKIEFVRFNRDGTIDRRKFHTNQVQQLMHLTILFWQLEI